MSNINLLPWREVAKQRQKKMFLGMLGGVFLVSAGLVLVVNFLYQQAISRQEARNQYLQSEIVVLDARIGEINKLKQRRKELIDRMRLIDQLQQSRNQAVHLFNDLPELVVSGIYLDSLSFTNGLVSVVGKTEAHSRVATMMRLIDRSQWLGQTSISSIYATANSERASNLALSEFSLMFRVIQKDNAGDPKVQGQGAQKK